jgi:ABC-type multidrug transport system fused ATPase/permease subunit
MSTSTALPIADSRTLRAYVRQVARTYPRMLGGSLTLHVLAALTALAAPRLLGDLVEAVDEGTTTAYVDQVVMWLAGFLVVQTVLTRYARFLSQALGEQVLARLREDFVSNALALPVGTVESAGSGDLLTRPAATSTSSGGRCAGRCRSGRSRSSRPWSRSSRRSASGGG